MERILHLLREAENRRDPVQSSGFLMMKRAYEAENSVDDDFIFSRFKEEFQALNRPKHGPYNEAALYQSMSLPKLPKNHILTPTKKYGEFREHNQSERKQPYGESFPYISSISPLSTNKYKPNKNKIKPLDYHASHRTLQTSESMPHLSLHNHRRSFDNVPQEKRLAASDSVSSLLFGNSVTPPWPKRELQPETLNNNNDEKQEKSKAEETQEKTMIKTPAGGDKIHYSQFHSPIQIPQKLVPLSDDKQYFIRGTPNQYFIGANKQIPRGKMALSPEFNHQMAFMSRETGAQIK